MLKIAAEVLPKTELTYVAFRLAFQETLERIVLAQQISLCGDWTFGYLTEVPFLKQVAPRVQLDLLLETWQRHVSHDARPATLLDQSVVYGACETAARLTVQDRDGFRRFLAEGPLAISVQPTTPLAESLRQLQVQASGDAEFLLLSQFLDMPPREARTLKAEFGILPDECEPLFEVLGRWVVSPDFRANAQGLLTDEETREAAEILRLQ